MNQAATDASNGQAFKPDSGTCSHAAVQRRGPVRSGTAALFSRIAEHTHSRVLMPVRVRPGQFEFKMRFRSVRVQRLPRFAINRHAAEIPFL
jgi:hypothetical protein